MTKRNTFCCALSVLVSLLVSGCSPTVPMNSAEFEQQLKATGTSQYVYKAIIKTVTVNRPFPVVESVLKQKTEECLRVRAKKGGWSNAPIPGGHMQRDLVVIDYTPTLKSSHNRLNLSLQMNMHAIKLGKEPPGGPYILTAQVTALSPNSVELSFHSSNRAKTIVAAIEGWANGSSMECPDLWKDTGWLGLLSQ